MSAYSDRVIADGAIYYWRLGEPSGTTAADSVGGRTGTISGDVTLGLAGPLLGDSNTAMRFNGVNGKIVTLAGPLLKPLTIECWFYRADQRYHTFLLTNTLALDKMSFDVRGPDGDCMMGFGLAGSSGGTAGSALSLATSALNTWHHYVGTLSGTTINVYVDGVLSGTHTNVSLGPWVGTTTEPFTIGSTVPPDTPGAAGWMKGTLDELAVYPTALSADTILAHYVIATQSGAGGEVGTEINNEILHLRDVQYAARPTQPLDSTTLLVAEIARVRNLDTTHTPLDTNTLLANAWDGIR